MRKAIAMLGLLGCLTLYAVAQNPSCGSLNDTAVHTPPQYSCSSPPCTVGGGSGQPLAPPSSVNDTYSDPQYSCTIKRMTTFGEQQSGQASHNFYSTTTSISAQDGFIQIIQDNSAKYIISLADGSLVVPISNFPTHSDPYFSDVNVTPWDRVTDYIFYHANGNVFYRDSINNGSPVSGCKPNCTVTSTALHTFSGFTNILVPDDENISQGNQYIWLIGTSSSGVNSSVAICYDFKNNIVVSSALTVGGQDSGSNPSWHKIQVFPSGKMFLTVGGGNTSLCGGGAGGQCIYNTDGSLYWAPPWTYSSHTGVGTDLSGHEVMIAVASGTDTLNACGQNSQGRYYALTVVDINAKSPLNCLIGGTGTGCVGTASCAGPWLQNWEISYEDSPNGWILLTICEDGCGGPGLPDIAGFDTVSPSRLVSTWSNSCGSVGANACWTTYSEEVILAKVDGSAIYRLAHHRSRDGENFFAVPVGTISVDGTYLVYNSDFDISNTGDSQYSDVYMIATGINTDPSQPAPPTGLQAIVQ